MDGHQPRQPRTCTAPLLRPLLAVRWVMILMIAACASSSPAQPAEQRQTVRITGDRLSGIVLPIEPISGDIQLRALRASAWTVDDTKRLHLERDVEVRIGEFTFISDEAVVWLNRIPSAEGLINQIAVYFDEVEDPTRRAGLGASGKGLLVTGSARGDVKLHVTLLEEESSNAPIVRRGEQRLRDHLRNLLAGRPLLQQYPQAEPAPTPEMPPLVPGGVPPGPDELPDLPSEIELPPAEDEQVPLFVPTGVISLNAGSIEIIPGEDENVVIASDRIVVEYTDERPGEGPMRLMLSAARGVVFTQPGPISELPSLAVDAEFVKGVYLEGNVLATDGNYTIHGNRVYYDVQRQQAIMLDGVLRTYARELGRPVFARAREFRQIARDQWTAKKATASTSEFHTPHLAIGAGSVTVTQRSTSGGGSDAAPSETYLDAEDITVRLGGVPVFWWPGMRGTLGDVPLRSVEMGYEDNNGFELLTSWNLYTLLGREPPAGHDAALKLDTYTDRGPAVGVGVEYIYNLRDTTGVVDLYGLFDDGIDKTSTGREVDSDQELRGVALWAHDVQLTPNLDLQLQTSYISDETFITTFREDDFAERREYETSAYLRHVERNAAFTVLAKADLEDFISNSWLLASRQYQVEKLPELAYRRFGDSLFGDSITYTSEYSASRMRLSFEENLPDALGIRARGFGIPRDEPFDEALLEPRGLREMFVNRLDTRHEIAMPMQWGALDVTPFLVGRATWYDEEFETFSSDSSDLRLFGAAGLRLSTVFQHVNNDVENRLLDLHRLRHIVEPSLMLWYGYADVDQSNLPTYDERVESLADGAAVRFGLENTWQTQRGGPGRWRSVDVLTLDTALILTSSETDLENPVPRFFAYRPEYSNLGDHVDITGSWLLSDSLSLVGETIYDLDDSRVARGSIGALLQHSPLFTTYIEFRYLDASDNELLGIGWNYQITPKYRIALSPQWDFRFDEFRSLRLTVTRSFPDFDVGVQVKRDEIKDDTSVSATMQLRNF